MQVWLSDALVLLLLLIANVGHVNTLRDSGEEDPPGSMWLRPKQEDDQCAYIEATSAAIRQLTDSFTVEAFVKTDQTDAKWGDASILEKWTSSYHHPEHRSGFPIALRLWASSGRLQFLAHDGHKEKPMATSWTRINDNKWHHIVAVRERETKSSPNGRLQLYIDGRLEGEASKFAATAHQLRNDDPFTFGKRPDQGNCFKGALALVRVYDRPIVPSALKTEGLLAVILDWRFTARETTTEPDVSGHGGEGTLHADKGAEPPLWSSHGPSQPGPSTPLLAHTTMFQAHASTDGHDSLDNDLEHFAVAEWFGSRYVTGSLFRLSNPRDYLHFLPPQGGCPNLRTVSETAKAAGCYLATNAGLFDTETGACHGNLVHNGHEVVTGGSENVNLGLTKDGMFVTGYIPLEQFKESQNYNELISGMVWLLRNGSDVVHEAFTHEDMLRQETGDAERFVTVRAPRLAVGHDAEGRFVMLQLDGDEEAGTGVDLYEMSRLFKRYGALNAINLDGGSSDAVWWRGMIVNTPMHDCRKEAIMDKIGRCERNVSTIVCVRPPVSQSSHSRHRKPVDRGSDDNDDDDSSALNKPLFILIVTALVVGIVAGTVALVVSLGSSRELPFEHRHALSSDAEMSEISRLMEEDDA